MQPLSKAATYCLAKYLSGDIGQAALDEKIRHDKALKKYQAAYAKYQKRSHRTCGLQNKTA